MQILKHRISENGLVFVLGRLDRYLPNWAH